MKHILTILALIAFLAVQSASAQLMQTGVGPGASGSGTFTPSFLLIDVGSSFLINTGSKLEIHS